MEALILIGIAGFLFYGFIKVVASAFDYETPESNNKSYSVRIDIEYDDIFKGKIKLGTPRVEYLKRGGVKKISVSVTFTTMSWYKEVGAKTTHDLKLKIEKLLDQWATKYKKQIDKENESEKKLAFKEFSESTIELFGIDVDSRRISSPGVVHFNLKDEINVVEKSNDDFFNKPVKLTNQKLSNFVLDGRFNSVIGIDGLNNFKKDILENIDINEQNKVKADYIKELVFKYGIHYDYESAPDELRKYDDESKWKALFRLILKYTDSENLSNVKIQDFKDNHRMIFDEFSDNDLIGLDKAVYDTAILLSEDLDTYFSNLKERISA